MGSRLLRRILLLPMIFLSGCIGTPTPNPTPTSPEVPIVGAPNPAAPPAPPAELPSALRIPEDLSINVDKTRSESEGGALVALVGSGGEFSLSIAFASDLVFTANGLLEYLLKPLRPIEIPVSESRTEMDAFVAIGTTIYDVHLDFDDFDLDGDGAGEGCSGHTAALPVCVRVWISDGSTVFRLLAARFDAFPTDLNSGAGSVRGMQVDFYPPPAAAGHALIAANYDHTDPENRFTDSFYGFLDEENDPESSSVPQRYRAFASQVGPDDTALKTANGSEYIEGQGPFGGPLFRQGLGRWLEGDDPDRDFWSGSLSSNGLADHEDFFNICAQISTGDGVDQGICQNLGIDTEGLNFLDFTTAQDLLFFDFPATAP